MIEGLAVTAIMLRLAFAAFLSPSGCDNGPQHLGAPFGILFAVIAAITWFMVSAARHHPPDRDTRRDCYSSD